MSDDPAEIKRAAEPETGSWFHRKGSVTRIGWALFLVCAVLMLMDVAIHRHAEVEFDGNFGFYAAYGFFSSVLLVLVGKLMRRVLKRPEGYYDD